MATVIVLAVFDAAMGFIVRGKRDSLRIFTLRCGHRGHLDRDPAMAPGKSTTSIKEW